MKRYKDYARGNISMIDDSGLSACLKSIQSKGISTIIETGTFEGTGSTRTVGNLFAKASLKAFYTIEINYGSYRKAVRNLKDLPFVHCLYGCSVPMRDALKFIQEDEAIAHHEKYPDVYIDDVEDPVGFYSKEIEGYLRRSTTDLRLIFRPRPQQDLLATLIRKLAGEKILFILDSAGGIGWLEFTTVQKEMGNKEYYLLLDDTHHLKHFRSVEYIKADPGTYDVIGESQEHGWLLCFKKKPSH